MNMTKPRISVSRDNPNTYFARVRGGGVAVCLRLAALIALAALVLGGAISGAQTSELTLVDNTNEAADATPLDLLQDRAMVFFTGTDHFHYWLNSVELEMEVSSGSETAYTVKLYSTVSNAPGTELATLTNPASLRTGLNRFTAPGGYRLDADTGYWVVVSVTTDGDNDPHLRMTTSSDQEGEEGWSTGSAFYQKARGATNWSVATGMGAPQFRVTGSLGPAAAITLVDNTDNTFGSDTTFGQDRALGFGTGSKAGGYRLSSVELDLLITDPSQTYPLYTVKLYSSVSNAPGTELATLTNPPTLSTTGPNIFTAPGGYLLDADTTYWIVVSISTDGNIGMRMSLTTEKGETGEAGWTIDDGHAHKARSATTWTTDSANVPRFKVNGFADVTAPAVRSAEVFFNTLTITFNEALDEDSVPSEDAFTVTADGSEVDLDAVNPASINGSTVTLALASTVSPGTAVTVSYTPPDSDPLRDYPGNQVAQFANQPVTNNTPDIETGMIYEAQGGGHRVIREDDGHCYRYNWEPGGYGTWHRSESYGNDDDACRKAAWDAYRASMGEEALGPDSDDFPTGRPPGLAPFSCPSGWVKIPDAVQSLCAHEFEAGYSGISFTPERARQFVALGLRPSDGTSTNPLRWGNFWRFVGGRQCGEGEIWAFNDDGELGCSTAEYERLQPGFGNSATDRRPPATGTAIPREVVRGPWVPPVYDPELGRYTARGHYPILRDENGNIVTRERANPHVPCGTYWR